MDSVILPSIKSSEYFPVGIINAFEVLLFISFWLSGICLLDSSVTSDWWSSCLDWNTNSNSGLKPPPLPLFALNRFFGLFYSFSMSYLSLFNAFSNGSSLVLRILGIGLIPSISNIEIRYALPTSLNTSRSNTGLL